MPLNILATDATSLMNIIDATPASIQIISSDGVFLDCNAATYSMFRARSTEDIIGKPPSILSPEKQSNGTDSNEGAAYHIKKAFSGEAVTFEWEHQRFDGTVFPCQVTLQIIEYAEKNCLMATMVDISNIVDLRKKTELIIENSPNPIIALDPDLSIQSANQAFADLTDIPREGLTKMKLTEFNTQNRVGRSLAEGIETKSQVSGVLDAVFARCTKHMQYYYSPIFNDDNELISIIAYYIDKTAENKAVNDIISLTEKSQAGCLDARLDPAPYSGELKLLMEGINGTLDSIIGPLNVAAEYVDRIGKGDLPPRITEEYKGDFNEIKNNLNNCINSLTRLLSDTSKMYQEHKAGDIDTSIDLSPYQGFYRDITSGYNDAISLHVNSVLKILAILTAYSEGDFNPVLEKMPGKQVLANEKMDQLRSNILALVQDCNLLTQAAVEGRLDVRVNAGKHQGDYRKIVEGINSTLDAVIGPLRDAGAVLERMALNDHTKGMDEAAYLGDFVAFAASINAVRERVNHIADSIVQISEGDLSDLDTYRKIGRRSEQDRLVPGLIKVFENLQALTNDTNLLVNSAAVGNLDIRADALKHEGEFRKIIEGINATIDSIANKVAWFESILDAIPFPVSVTDLNMNWTFLNPVTAKMANVDRKQAIGTQCSRWNANICQTKDCGIECLRAGKKESFFEQDGGFFKVDISYVKDAAGKDIGHVEVIQDITAIKKVEKYLDESVYNITICLGQFAKGKTDFDVQVPESDQYTKEVREKIVTLTNNLHLARDSVKNLVIQANGLAQAAIRGDLKHRADATQVAGDFAEVVHGVNKTLETVGIPLNTAAKWIEDVAYGRNVEDITDEYPGDYAVIKNNINKSNRVLKDLVAETERLSKGATAGDLQIRGDLSRYTGAWKGIVGGINETLDSVVTPVQEAIRVSGLYAKSDFTARFDPSMHVAGDWVGFKSALDDIGIQICNAIGAINKQILELASNAEEATASVQEVSAGAQQIAKNAGSVSVNAEQGDDGVTQVLKAMEDLTITVGEVSQRAEKVSGSATLANEFSKEGIDLAKKSESAMNGITKSTTEVDQIVKEINQQMEEIGKIVRLITDISNQTNLLALNAAIEAARAGEAGRGFAVVAAEVKSLAQDSRASAENIADMISNLQAKAKKANDAIITAGSAVKDGNQSLVETMGAFSKIADSVEDITKNAMDMASSSEEQAASVEEITASVNEVSLLLQGTSREAGDAAAATEEASASIEQIGRVVANVSGIADVISREMTKFKI